MSMRLCSLGSGSAGNSTLIATDSTRILVDAGLSVKTLTARMKEIDESPDQLDAILVTHEHSDHAGRVALLMKHLTRRGRSVPVHLTEGTASAIDWEGVEQPAVKIFKAGTKWPIGDVQISTFTVPHDCADPVAFRFETNTAKIGYAVDLGFVPDALRFKFRDIDLLFMESNHDLQMLETGGYPLKVKLRVAGRYGHLSNKDLAEYIWKDLGSNVRRLVLGHISRDNNTNEKVIREAHEALDMRGSKAELSLALQNERTEVFTC